MLKYENDDVIIFTSGRSMYANRLIVGLDPELTVFQGYDGGIGWPDDRRLTDEDMRELADMMIDRWTRFKATL